MEVDPRVQNRFADANLDFVVDSADYTIWRNHFELLTSESVATISVPEPGGGLMLIAALLLGGYVRGRTGDSCHPRSNSVRPTFAASATTPIHLAPLPALDATQRLRRPKRVVLGYFGQHTHGSGFRQ